VLEKQPKSRRFFRRFFKPLDNILPAFKMNY
jgi:hypothetical protein